MPDRPFVVGIDFDGTLAQYRGGAGRLPPLPPIPGSRELVNRLAESGCVIVIWTCRDEDDTILAWCKLYGITVHAINKNPFFPKVSPKDQTKFSEKIFCDVYYDDRGMHCPGNHDGAFEEIMRRRAQWVEESGHGDD